MGGGAAHAPRRPRSVPCRGPPLPLTPFQHTLLASLANAPAAGRYLAGGAALHFAPHSARYSDDLDFFHDSEARVAAAFGADRTHLDSEGYVVELEISQPGFIRAVVSRDGQATRVDWAHDSAWRFMPLVPDTLGGWLLHPVDLALNKLLALAGRDEPRDFVDILYAHRVILPLGGLVWAAAGKDPGLSPRSVLELLRRRRPGRPAEYHRLHLAAPFDLEAANASWRLALDDAEQFVRGRPATELGCLYLTMSTGTPALPTADTSLADEGLVVHFGAPGGVLPKLTDTRLADATDGAEDGAGPSD